MVYRAIPSFMRSVVAMLALFAASCSGPVPDPVPVQGPVAAAPSDFASEILYQHNFERRSAGVAPLVWDAALAANAAAYARQLARLGTLRHSNRAARPGQGENLWMGTRGYFSPRLMITNWASEKARFRPGIFPRVSTTGNWADVGHYSQMIWPTTTRLGCAIASAGRNEVLVCRYSPAGNIDGRRVP